MHTIQTGLVHAECHLGDHDHVLHVLGDAARDKVLVHTEAGHHH